MVLNYETVQIIVLDTQLSCGSVTTLTSSGDGIPPSDLISPTLSSATSPSNEKLRVSATRNCNLETRSAQYTFWMSQVEMNTHAPPHRRLWMGPQFTFKTILSDQSDQSAPANLDLGDTRPHHPQLPPNNSSSALGDKNSGSMSSVALIPTSYFQSIDKFDLDILR